MRRSFVTLGLAATVGLAACGSGTTAHGPSVVVRDPVRLVAATADATAHAKTAKVAITATIDAPGALLHSMSFGMDGAIALDGSAADFTMNLGSLLPSAPKNARVEARLVDGVMYMDMGAMMRALGAGQSIPGLPNLHWLKLDLHGLSGGAGVGSSPAEFTQYLSYLDAASAQGVQTVGHETVRGVDTTHYRAQLDWAKIVAQSDARLAKLSPDMRALAQRGVEALRDTKGTIDADVWIDADGLARRFEMHIPFPSSSSTSSSSSSSTTSGSSAVGSMTMRMDFYDFGTTVDVQPPPADEVTDMSSLGGLLGGALSGAQSGSST